MTLQSLIFSLEHQDAHTQARAGRLSLTHGEVLTPIFMPVGTRASVKAVSQQDLKAAGAQIILANTYHLYLRPGHQLIEECSSTLHQFMSWDRPILTDSGGFQVYSLSALRKITEEGVRFQSHIDGSPHMLGPEQSMQIQRALGSDIVMAFDECPALPADRATLEAAVARTTRWAQRCKNNVELRDHQHLFGIVQGGLDLELRRHSLAQLQEIGFDGYAIGGLSVGEKNEEMVELLQNFTPSMPTHSARYLMGVGKPLDILNGIRAGIDMFDCVLPTRNARNGQIFTRFGSLSIKQLRFQKDSGPLDPDCSCAVCQNYSRHYLRHLYLVGEYLCGQLLTFHNLHFFIQLTQQARAAICEDRFDDFYKNFYKDYTSDRWNRC